MSGSIVAVEPSERARWQAPLRAFEREFTYPLGDDRFHIDHGDDYFAFFDALGDARPFVATDGDRTLGVFVAIARGGDGEHSWYLCDLKVAADASTQRIGSRLLRAWQQACHRPGEPVFGVSMDPRDGANRLARIARRSRRLGPLRAATLAIFSVDHQTWRRVAAPLRRALGALSFFDPRGTKDIVLESTGAPMRLLHLQHGPFARRDVTAPREDHTHMFCLPADDPLLAELHDLGVAPDAAASLLHSPELGGWRHLLTSDI